VVLAGIFRNISIDLHNLLLSFILYYRETNPVRRHRVSAELDDLLSVAFVKDVHSRYCPLTVTKTLNYHPVV
jgi:hypothetical protein